MIERSDPRPSDREDLLALADACEDGAALLVRLYGGAYVGSAPCDGVQDLLDAAALVRRLARTVAVETEVLAR